MPSFHVTDRKSFSALFSLLRVVALLALPSANFVNSQAASLVVDVPHPQAPPAFTAVDDYTPQEEEAFFPLNRKRRYDIGDLTGDEQAYVELVNRARVDPKAEGRRLVETEDPDVLAAYRSLNVDLDWVLNAPEEGFNHLPVAGVLVPNAALTKAARRHTQDMFDNNFQGHGGSDGSQPQDRARDAGYNKLAALGENVYVSADSVFDGHAAFNVDWGRNEPRGIQTPPGHRLAIHNPLFQEIGVGVINGSKENVGPQLVTQEFGTRHDITPFVTGVAYYDLNGNRFYDSGEGLGGIRVDVEGSNFYALTRNSGGFGVPVPRNGRYQVTFSGAGFAEEIVSAVVARSRNTKVDFSPLYQPPQIAGPDTISTEMDTSFTFSTVGGATAYQWQQNRLLPIDGIEGAETRLSDFEQETTGRYSIRTLSVKHSGQYSFHLVHPTGDSQFLNWNRVFRPGKNSALRFRSRLTVAAPDEIAQVQASVDGGAHWTVIWSQAGNVQGGTQRGESRFRRRTVDLSSFASQHIRLRFVFAFQGGKWFPYTGTSPIAWGWYFDDLELVDTMEVAEPLLHESEEVGRFAFAPPSEGDYLLEVRAQVSDRWYPFGPSKLVTASRSAIIEPPPMNRPPLIITAEDVVRQFGETNPVFVVSYLGFVNGEGPDVLGGALVFDEGGGTDDAVAGVYDLTPSGLTSSNYDISFVAGSITVTKAPAEVTLADLVQGHDGLPKMVSVVTVPEGLAVDVTYDGSSEAPIVQGSYAVSAIVNDSRYSGSAEGALRITDSAAVILADLAQVYDGAPRMVSVTTDPAGLEVAVTYDGSAEVPVGAGMYEVRAEIDDPNGVYSGFAEGTLVVAKGSAQISFVPGSLTWPISGIAAAEVVTVPADLNVGITYSGVSALPQVIGGYDVVATIDDVNWVGSVAGIFEIVRAPQQITMQLPARVENPGRELTYVLFAAATSNDPVNLPVEFSIGSGTDASALASVSGNFLTIRGTGNIELVASQAGNDYWASVERTFTIEVTGQPAVRLAEIQISDLEQEYDGNPKSVGVATVPAGLTTVITYDGSLEVPVNAGTYEVRVVVSDEDYEGEATAMLTITPSATKIPVDIEITNLEHKYDGNPKSAMVTMNPAGIAVSITYNGSPEAPVNAGTYEVRVVVTAETHEGFKIDRLVIAPGDAQISFVADSLSQLAGQVSPAEVVTVPVGLVVSILYDGLSDVPDVIGEYAVVATVEDSNWEGRAAGTFTIRLASQEITIGDLRDFSPWPIPMAGMAMIIGPPLPSVEATSGLPVTLEVDESNSTGEATLSASGNRLIVTQPGAIVLIARQAGNDSWAPAEKSFTITVTGRGVPVQAPQVIRVTRLEIANGQVRVAFESDSGEPQAFDLLVASDPSGPWRIDPTANILALDNGFAATTSATDADEQYYRIQSR